MYKEFVKWPKTPRYTAIAYAITEKIDGTNACVSFNADGEMVCQSRTRIITPGKETDNYGFAQWAYDNQEELFSILGVGRHYGEWWGQGIQRGYGLEHKVFSLFNTIHWNKLYVPVGHAVLTHVPLLGHLPMLYSYESAMLSSISELGQPRTSLAARAFGITYDNLEGYMAMEMNSKQYFKIILDK